MSIKTKIRNQDVTYEIREEQRQKKKLWQRLNVGSPCTNASNSKGIMNGSDQVCEMIDLITSSSW